MLVLKKESARDILVYILGVGKLILR